MAKKIDKRKDPRYNIDTMLKNIESYIKSCNDPVEPKIPIIKDLCLINGWQYNYVYELAAKNPELADALQMVKDLKEVTIERGGLTGVYNSKMAELSLIQLGWSKKEEISISATDDLLKTVSIDSLRSMLNTEDE